MNYKIQNSNKFKNLKEHELILFNSENLDNFSIEIENSSINSLFIISKKNPQKIKVKNSSIKNLFIENERFSMDLQDIEIDFKLYSLFKPYLNEFQNITFFVDNDITIEDSFKNLKLIMIKESFIDIKNVEKLTIHSRFNINGNINCSKLILKGYGFSNINSSVKRILYYPEIKEDLNLKLKKHVELINADIDINYEEYPRLETLYLKNKIFNIPDIEYLFFVNLKNEKINLKNYKKIRDVCVFSSHIKSLHFENNPVLEKIKIDSKIENINFPKDYFDLSITDKFLNYVKFQKNIENIDSLKFNGNYCNNPLFFNFCKNNKIPYKEDNILSKSIF